MKKPSVNHRSLWRAVTALVAVGALALATLAYSFGYHGDPARTKKQQPSTASAQRVQPVDGQESAKMSPEGMQQIEALLAEKESRTPEQQKIDSQLLQAVRESRGEEMAAGVHLEKMRLNDEGTDMVKVDISATVTDDLVTRLEDLGSHIIYPSFEYNTIRAEVNLSAVETIAGFSDVKFIEPAVGSHTAKAGATDVSRGSSSYDSARGGANGPANIIQAHRLTLAEREARVRQQLAGYLARYAEPAPAAGAVKPFFTGPTTSEGDHAHRADDTRNLYGYSGAGIKVGVLSDSYNALGGAAADVATGDLPGVGNPLGNLTPVTVVEDFAGGADEGRAMLQIVHDLAPKAQLFFATADVSEADFANNIKVLRNTFNCDIIIDDVSYFDEPVFQDGIVAQAVNTVTASGAMYFSSAGNEGNLAKGTFGYYENDFNDAGSPAFTFPGGTKAGTIHNFGTVATPINGDIITLVSPNVYTLNWADPMGASTNDYDLFLLSSTGTVKRSSTNVQSGTQNPYEQITAPALAAGDRLAVFKRSTAAVRAFSIDTNGGGLTLGTTGETHGHSSAADAYSVAAAPSGNPFGPGQPVGPYPGAYTSANQIETFSSDGPRRVFYNADGSPITAGNFLFGTSGGTVRNKPDITAADGVTTSGNSLGAGLDPFYGTSAAAPHAGAIAALIKSAKPSLTTAQIRTIITTTALDIESGGYDNISGFGIVQAFQAMQAVTPTPLAILTLGTVSATEGSVKNNNGQLDPGELANIVVQLTNQSMVNAANVNATLVTSTPGVTVVQNSAAYGAIGPLGTASNTASPFMIGISSTVPCGTLINFVLTATYTGSNSPQSFPFTVRVGSAPFSISGTLGLTPPTGSGFTSTSGQQTGRLSRSGVVATCAATKAAPGLTVTTGARQYDAYTFTNTSSNSQCVVVTLSSVNGTNIYTAAYTAAGFVPANPNTNFLADPGTSTNVLSYSFNIASGATFTVVVHDVNVLTSPVTQIPYTLSVALSNCTAGPACPTLTVTPPSLPSGATGSPYSQTFSATGGTGFYSVSVTGALPAGISLSGNTISGTPTQAGSFPLVVKVTDVTGCSATQNYTLVINGIAAASVTASAGGGQTVVPGGTFPIPLQALVRDGSNNPLGGVNVVFTAPGTGASGTFAGGALTATAVTNASGIATAPAFTANTTAGSYAVTATVNGVATPASFTLTNACVTTYTVTSNADSGPGTLREIINSGCSGVTVTFAPGVTSITLTSGELLITKAMTITGPGANLLTISGNHASRIFDITATTATVSISGLTVRDGATQGSAANGGGGILVKNSATGVVNLTDCVITNNDATLGAGGVGGGVDCEGGNVNITRCAIVNNVNAFAAGGIIIQTSGTLTLVSSTIAGNSSGTTGLGGGILVNRPVTLTNCTVFGNSAQTGGNIYRNSNTLTFKNNIIAGGILLGTGGSGPDVFGATGLSSADFNLIQTTTGGTISGTTTHNITGQSPNLLALGNYGGPSPTLLPLPSSPVINAGDTALTTGVDQRGLPRFIGGQADIGAVETNYALAATGGTPQSAVINANFVSALQATVTESNNPVNGVTVTYTAPASGASGLFGASATTTATTDATGVANSSTFTANGSTGSYIVTGSISSKITAVNFNLTNTGAAGSITATAGTPQTALVGQAYPTALQATVRDSNNTLVNNVTVTFTVVPNGGSGGTFPGGLTTATATTNASGLATAPTLTANSVGGTFTVNATTAGVGTPAVFNLTICGISCPSNIIQSTDAGQCNAVVTYTTPSAAAGCATVTCSPPSGSTFNKGVTTVNCQLGSTSVTCSFTVTVNDTQAPTITCPGNISQAAAAGHCDATVTYAAPTVSDNCSGVGTPTCTPPSGSTFNKGTTTVNCSVTDASSNSNSCSFTVTINDTEAPSITCPANMTRGTDAGHCYATVTYTTPTATDNCSGLGDVTCTPPSGSTFNKGVNTVTCSVTDGSSNSKSCSFTITVNDTEAPSITCPANISKPADAGHCYAVVTYAAPTVSDNCPGVGVPSCSPPSGSTFNKGTTTVNCSVTDASSNSKSCSFTVTVNDTQPPSITCPANISKAADAGHCYAAVTYAAPTVSDNCPGVGVPSCSPPSGSNFATGVTTVNCSVSDASGNMNSCSFTITVRDMQPPTITAPANITAAVPPQCPMNTTGIAVTFALPAASDACGLASEVCTPPSGSVFAIGTTTVNCTATDTSGNTASCSFKVHVYDVLMVDDANPNTSTMFNSNTGEYLICSGGQKYTGTGTVTKRGCTVSLVDNVGTRRLSLSADMSQKKGNGSMQSPPGVVLFNFSDRDMSNDVCNCSNPN